MHQAASVCVGLLTDEYLPGLSVYPVYLPPAKPCQSAFQSPFLLAEIKRKEDWGSESPLLSPTGPESGLHSLGSGAWMQPNRSAAAAVGSAAALS